MSSSNIRDYEMKNKRKLCNFDIQKYLFLALSKKKAF